jgi:hypothetical protein
LKRLDKVLAFVGLHAEVVEELGELFVGNAPIQSGN